MIIAVTGNTGSGKSTVARLFEEWGGELVDADRIGKAVWQKSAELQRQIVREIGSDVAGDDGLVDRRRLGRAVFADQAKLEALNRLLRPALHADIEDALDPGRVEHGPIIVLDAALLFEWEYEARVDVVVVVTAERELRSQRIRIRDDIDEVQAEGRIDSQQCETKKAENADHVIVNNGTLADLEKAARRVWDAVTGGK